MTSLDDIIANLKDASDNDQSGQEILAAALTLRDATGRDRKDALRSMAATWGVARNEKSGNKYVPRKSDALSHDIEGAVRQAFSPWLSKDGVASTARGDEGVVEKKSKTSDDADQPRASKTSQTGRKLQKPEETPEDLVSLTRLGPDLFEAHSAKAKVTAKKAARGAPEHAVDAPLHDDAIAAESAKRKRKLTHFFQAASSQHEGGQPTITGASEHSGANDADEQAT